MNSTSNASTWSPERISNAFIAACSAASSDHKLREIQTRVLKQVIPQYSIQQQHMGLAFFDAMDKNNVHVAFQPIFSKDGSCIKAEALVRWTHNKNEIPPSEFLYAATQCTRRHDLMRFMLNSVCNEISTWEKPIPVSINIDVSNLAEPEMVKTVLKTLNHYGVDPSLIEFEITESEGWMTKPDSIKAADELRKHGIKITIDSFGIANANFDAVNGKPVDNVKIDRSLLLQSMQLEGSRRKNGTPVSMLHAVIELLRQNNYHVTVNGVQTEKERQYAIACGAEATQGFYHTQAIEPVRFAQIHTGNKKSKTPSNWNFAPNTENKVIEELVPEVDKQLVEKFVDDIRSNSNRIQAYFQPKVDPKTQICKGAEALCRWFDETGKPYPLQQVLDAVQASEHKPKLIEWMLKQTIEHIAKWDNNIKISVNVDTKDLSDPKFLQTVINLVQTHGIDPKNLEFEILETMPIAASTIAVANTIALKNYGFSIALDDFGTSYSNYDSILTPINCIKLDRSLLTNAFQMHRKNPETNYFSDLIATFHTRGMQVTVEGVETREQEAFVRESQADLIQGYFYSKPLPASEFEHRYVQSVHKELGCLELS